MQTNLFCPNKHMLLYMWNNILTLLSSEIIVHVVDKIRKQQLFSTNQVYSVSAKKLLQTPWWQGHQTYTMVAGSPDIHPVAPRLLLQIHITSLSDSVQWYLHWVTQYGHRYGDTSTEWLSTVIPSLSDSVRWYLHWVSQYSDTFTEWLSTVIPSLSDSVRWYLHWVTQYGDTFTEWLSTVIPLLSE